MDLHKLQTRIKELGSNTGGKGFVYGLLLAYNIPRATLDRYESQMKKTSELGESLEIGRKVFVVITERDNLLSIFDNLKEKGLHKIKTRFILIANEQDLVIHDLLTEDTLKSTIPDFCKSFEFLIPLLGIRRIDSISNRSVDLKAAEKFAKLYNQLLLTNDYRDDSKRARLNVVMARILFCFFSDGVGLIEKGSVFRILSTYTDKSGMDLNMVLGEMFESLSTPEKRDIKEYLKAMPFIDSTLFCGDIDLPTFNKETRKLLLECAELDWSDINPDILGSLIQSIVFPESFHGLSNHFTSIPNIHKVIDPLFLNELYEDFEKNKDNYDDLMNLLKRIGRIKILDPSCGSGNFLIVLYKELKILENKIINIIRNITNGEKEPIVRVSMMQFYGIERNEFACEIAKLGLFFTECQLLLQYTGELTLSRNLLGCLRLKNIVNANATELDWEDVCPKDDDEIYIIGNPPYKGARKQTDSQKADVRRVFAGNDRIKNLDYVSCWFLKASQYIRGTKNAFAFVTTNSITQGEQVGLLWPILFKQNVHINFAHTAFKWKNSGRKNSAVTVVIIGMRSDEFQKERRIYTQATTSKVSNINPYLTSAGNLIVTRRKTPLSPVLPYMPKGNMPYDGGNLLLNPEEKETLVKELPESNKFLKRVMGSNEFIKGLERWCLWIEDKDLEEALRIKPIAERIIKVKEMRMNSTDSGAHKLAERPHQFRETRVTKTQSIIVPSVSSENRIYLPVGFVNKSTIITNLAFVIYDCEAWVFGVISSRIHNLWFRSVCGALETRLRYSSELGYNTFPFPEISEGQKIRIKECVYDVLSEREEDAGKTMAQKYDAESMSQGLLEAHGVLDAAVESCMREEPFLSDQERLEFLFQEYDRMRKLEGGA